MGNTKSSSSIEESREDSVQNQGEASRKPKAKSTRKLGGSARSSISSQGNRRPMLTANQRLVISYCLSNAKEDLAERILRRGFERRDDFKQFVLENLTRQQRHDLVENLKDFLLGVCENLSDSEEIQKMSEAYGANYTQYRSTGFKPDFFSATADAVTTECTFLDQAQHAPSEVAGSWSMLTSFVFSHVRDGYYAELRKQRKTINTFRNKPSFDVSTDGSGDQSSRRSASPACEDLPSDEPKDTPNFLLPPQVY
ncbi:hypothetical protein WR25_24523 [Diploscapter pachys]|uniref:Uncharacterized protein n=1 Tax=Diploscapter pachys TaxID=2018661 RepID=A0A2A2L7W7_9BILA|nr:hypothetical protein WR25_24523 [Diploscapter pachys]